MFWTRRAYGHIWLFYNGVVIWSRRDTYSYLMQVAPSTAERLPEPPLDRDALGTHADPKEGK